MRIALTLKSVVDLCGANYRLESELRQLKISQAFDEARGDPPPGYKDWGLVSHNGNDCYMATYDPPSVEEDVESRLRNAERALSRIYRHLGIRPEEMV